MAEVQIIEKVNGRLDRNKGTIIYGPYFRDTNLVKLEENKYIKEVNNWGDIYRFIRNEEK